MGYRFVYDPESVKLTSCDAAAVGETSADCGCGSRLRKPKVPSSALTFPHTVGR